MPWCTASGARPRLVCSSTPVALTTGRSRAAGECLGPAARAESGSPAAMASRAASTSNGCGKRNARRARASASTEGGRSDGFAARLRPARRRPPRRAGEPASTRSAAHASGDRRAQADHQRSVGHTRSPRAPRTRATRRCPRGSRGCGDPHRSARRPRGRLQRAGVAAARPSPRGRAWHRSARPSPSRGRAGRSR